MDDRPNEAHKACFNRPAEYHNRIVNDPLQYTWGCFSNVSDD